MLKVEEKFDKLLGLDLLETEMEITKSNLEYAEVGSKIKFKEVNYRLDPKSPVIIMVVTRPDMKMCEWTFADSDDVKDSVYFEEYYRWLNENRGPVNGYFYRPSLLESILEKVQFEGNKNFKE